MTIRHFGAVGALAAFLAYASAPTAAQDVHRPAVHVTLPTTNGFTDATDAMVQALELIREALATFDTIRLVDHPRDSDAVLTVLGRGTGHAQLTAALNDLDPDVIAPPVMIAANERYIQAVLTVGTCNDRSEDAATEAPSDRCYRRAVVGLGFADLTAPKGARRAAANSWNACAGAVARDVRAWVTQNAARLVVLRGRP